MADVVNAVADVDVVIVVRDDFDVILQPECVAAVLVGFVVLE
jgi:hypothetical protein